MFGTGLSRLADHALGQEIGKRFHYLDMPQIFEDPRVKSGIQQVQNSVFNAADILVHGQPVVHPFCIQGAILVVRARIAVKIPGRLYKSVHGIRFTSGFTVAFGASGFGKGQFKGQRRSPIGPHVQIQRQYHRQIFFVNRNNAAFFTMDHGDGCSPISLP